MPKNLRQIAEARRHLPSAVTRWLAPLEQSAHETAVQSATFAAFLLTSHAEAALPVSAGSNAIRLAAEAAQLAAESRAKLAAAHDELRLVLGEFFPMSSPECPPNEGAMPAPLRVVG